LREALAERGVGAHFVSAAAGTGVGDLLQQVAGELGRLVEKGPAAEELPIIEPRPLSQRFEVTTLDGVCTVRGQRVEAFAEMMPLEQEEGRQEFWRRLARWGVVNAISAGVKPGGRVRIGHTEWSGRMRIGVLGGTFDPPHLAHLILAQEALQALDLSKVLFVPAGEPWRKAGRELSPRADRLAMARLAVEDNGALVVSTAEVERPGPSYTAETLAELRSQSASETELFFIMGADSLADFPHWREPQRILPVGPLGGGRAAAFGRQGLARHPRRVGWHAAGACSSG
jgi:nicotinate (nicotinamide) nucleotide adenylyltransferase